MFKNNHIDNSLKVQYNTLMTNKELEKKINGNWTIKEIIEAMKQIAPEIRVGLASKAWNKTK